MMKYLLAHLFDKPISGEWGNEVEEGKLGVKVIRTTNFTNIGRLDLSSIVCRNIDIEKNPNKKLQYGDIIIEKSGGSPTQPVGRPVIFEEDDNEVYFCNNFTSILRPNDKIYPKYSVYLLRDLYNKKKVLKYQNKTTGIINIKLNDYINNTEVNIPSIDKQIKIANVLDKAQKLIDKRKKQIEELDELVKSRFIEMFGDPIGIIESGKTTAVENITDNVGVGFVGESTNEYRESGVPYLRMQNIRPMKIDEENLIYINEDFHKKIQKSNVFTGDIVISRVGVNRGMTALIPEKFDNSSIGNAIIIRAKNTFSPTFISFYINMIYGKHTSIGYSKGSAQGAISVGLVKKWPVPVVELNKQNQFADFVKQVDKLKFEMENSLKELEDNFNSLMQKAFKGELFN